MNHELKTDPVVYEQVVRGEKTFEIRKNDRMFTCGDTLLLRKTVSTGAQMAAGRPLEYTGNQHMVLVTSILHGPIYGLEDGWVIMSVRKL